MKRFVLSLAVAASVMGCASCAFLPSAPESLPVAVGVRDGGIIVLLPVCAGAEVDKIVFTPRIESGFDPIESHSWSAESYLGEGVPEVRLDPTVWGVSRGAIPDWRRPFGLDVWIEGAYAGTVVYEGEAQNLADLGEDYFAEGEVVSREEFMSEFGPSDCPNSFLS